MLTAKAEEYRLLIVRMRQFNNSTVVRMREEVEVARSEILAEIERRKG